MRKSEKQKEIVVKLENSDTDNNKELNNYLSQGYTVKQISACSAAMENNSYVSTCYVLLILKDE